MSKKFNGRKLKELRKLHNLSLQHLADMTGSSKSYIWELESDKDINPSGYKVCLFATCLNVPAPYFYDMVEIDTGELNILATQIIHLVSGLMTPNQPPRAKQRRSE